MRAIVYTRYGAPEVLTLTERDKPVPRFNQVLVKVHAVSLNPLEWHHLRGKPLLVRISAGLAKPKPEYQVQGIDVAGIVDALGADVTRFKVGDTVFGNAPFGGLADFVAVKEAQLSIMPVGFSMIEATCLPVAGGTALQALREYGKVQAGDHVLINGSSGGVGIFSVQIAKALGARVTAVCSTRNIELVRSLGADEVLDYTVGDVTRAGKLYDVVLDNVGNFSLQTFKRSLKPAGRGVVVGFTQIGRFLHIALFGKMRGRSIAPMFAYVTPEVLATLKGYADAGQLRSVIDRTWPLEKTSDALACLEGYHARGKVVVTLAGAAASPLGQSQHRCGPALKDSARGHKPI